MSDDSLKPAKRAVFRARAVLGVAFVGMALMSGCATRQNPDPLESWNRKVFAFNDGLDRRVVRPVAQAYKAVTPDFFRVGVSNFFGNFKDMMSTTNLFLQGRFADGAMGVMRVSMNTTFGLAGVLDVATPMQLYRQDEDFGQTLGAWGVGPGAYIVWPFFGSSTLRDSAALPADLYFSPTTVMHNAASENRVRVLNVVNLRANYLDASNLMLDVALDPYAFVRDAYLQRRQSLVYNGDPPEEEDDAPPGDDPSRE